MHINQRLKAVLFTGAEQPINRPLLIGLQVVGIEVIQEIAADHLSGRSLAAESIGNKAQVLLQCILTVDLADKVNELPDNIVIKVIVIADGQDVIAIRYDGFILGRIPLAAGVGKSLNVKRIAAEEAAYSVGDERDDLIPHGTDVVAALHGFWHIVTAIEHTVHGHILVRHIRCQFVLQAVNVNENAIEFFFVLFKLLEALFALSLPGSIFLGNQSSHFILLSQCNFPELPSILQVLPMKPLFLQLFYSSLHPGPPEKRSSPSSFSKHTNFRGQMHF